MLVLQDQWLTQPPNTAVIDKCNLVLAVCFHGRIGGGGGGRGSWRLDTSQGWENLYGIVLEMADLYQ